MGRYLKARDHRYSGNTNKGVPARGFTVPDKSQERQPGQRSGDPTRGLASYTGRAEVWKDHFLFPGHRLEGQGKSS